MRRAGIDLSDDQRKLYGTLKHFPELRQSRAATAAMDMARITIPPEALVPKRTKDSVHDRKVEKERETKAKFQELTSSVLFEVDNQYEDLKAYMREHRERYRAERRCHLKLLETPGTMESSESVLPPSPLQTACSKLVKAGIYFSEDLEHGSRDGKYDKLVQEVRCCGLRQVLCLPPYVVLPDAGPIEFSSQSCKTNRPSWKKPTIEQEFQQHLRERLETMLCVRLGDEELVALFDAMYGSVKA